MARQLSNPVYLASPEKGVDGRTTLAGARAPVITDGRIGDFWIDTRTDEQRLYGPKNAAGWPDLGLIKGNRGWTPVFSAVTDGNRRVQQIVDWQGGEGPKPATGKYVGPTGLVDTAAAAVDIRGPEGPEMIIDGLGPGGDTVTYETLVPAAEAADDNKSHVIKELFSAGGTITVRTTTEAEALNVPERVGYIVISDIGVIRQRVDSEPGAGGKHRSADRWLSDEQGSDSANGGWWSDVLSFAPPRVANSMAVTTSDGTVREEKTFAEVRSLLGTYATKAALAAATVFAGLTSVEVLGHDVVGDCPPIVLTRIATPSPAEPWHWQSADGAYWSLETAEAHWTQFGVKFDGGVVDNTVAMQAGIDWAKLGERTLYGKQGVVRITASLDSGDSQKVRYEGRGMTILCDFASALNGWNAYLPSDCYWCDISLDGDYETNGLTSHGFSINSPTRCEFERVKAHDVGGFGIICFTTLDATACPGNYYRYCEVDGNGNARGGLGMAQLSYSHIISPNVKNLNVSADPSYGLNLKNKCLECTIVGGSVENCPNTGIAFSSDGPTVEGEGCFDCIATGVAVKNCPTGVSMNKATRCHISASIDMADNATAGSAVLVAGANVKCSYDVSIFNVNAANPAVISRSNDQLIVVRQWDGTGLLLWDIQAADRQQLILMNYTVASSSYNPAAAINDASGNTNNRFINMRDYMQGTVAGGDGIIFPWRTASQRLYNRLSLNDAGNILSARVNNVLQFDASDLNKSFDPGADNTFTLGRSGRRWSQLWAATGTINTSDARQKTAVAPMTAEDIVASKLLAREIGTFRFLQAVETKGDDARLHIGMTVQRAMEIMESCGLDPMRYGFICYDQWGDEYRDELQEDGSILQIKIADAGDGYGFRPDELLAFIARGLEARLSALEEAAGI